MRNEFINPEKPSPYLFPFAAVSHADKITNLAFKFNDEISEVVKSPSSSSVDFDGGVRTKNGSLKPSNIPDTSACVANAITPYCCKFSFLKFFSVASVPSKTLFFLNRISSHLKPL